MEDDDFIGRKTLAVLTFFGETIPPVVNILPFYQSMVSEPKKKKTCVYIQEKIGISEKEEVKGCADKPMDMYKRKK